MQPTLQDVDIDINDDFNPSKLFTYYTRASQIKQDKLISHNVGFYFQQIPTDPWNPQQSSIPYDIAQQLGFQKIDFLHLTFLDNFKNKNELRTLMKQTPNWDLLNHQTNVVKLFQIGNHFDVVSLVKPKSIDDLADVVALIRPGKKRLLERYLKDKQYVRSFLYKKTDQYYFKRSHAIGYAHVIAVQLLMIETGAM